MFTVKMSWKETNHNGLWTIEDAWYAGVDLFCFHVANATKLTKRDAINIANRLAADSTFTDNCGYNIKLSKITVVKVK